jgi:hypothetical protein
MFRLVTEVEAPWPVRFEVVNEAGAVETAEITLTFRRIGLKEFRALFGPLPEDRDVIAYNRQLFDRLVTGWKGVLDGAGKPLAFTDENIEALLDFPGFAAAFGRAYSEFWSALPEAREKNSAPSPAGGPATEALTAEAPNSGRA